MNLPGSWLVFVGMAALCAGAACGQNYPYKPIRIVTGEVGGANDFMARLIAQGITGPMGQQVIVDNRAGGVIPGVVVSKALPDGYSMLVAGGVFLIGPLLQKTPYDPIGDFSPVTLATMSPSILVVHPSLPVKSVKELIALAKAKPGALNYASAAAGAPSHIAGELFKSMAGIDIVRIPYKGGGPSLNALLGGEVQLMFAPSGAVAPLMASGKVRALAVTSAQPTALLPGATTVSATVPGYESVSLYGVFAPAKTPAVIINRLNQEIVRFLRTAEAKDKLLNIGVEVVASSAEQFAATVKSEMAKVDKLIKDAGIRSD